MEGHYQWGLASFYIALFIITALSCIAVRDDDSFIKGVFLGILFLANQSDYFWLSPEHAVIYHMGVVLLILLAFQNVKKWKAFLIIVYVIFISDWVWILMPEFNIAPNYWNFPYDIYYWQSILNISLAILCFTVIKGCYDTHKIGRMRSRIKELDSEDGNISAFEKVLSVCREMVRQTR